MDCSPPDSSVHGIFQARILEWLPFPPPGGLPDPGIEPISRLLHWQAGFLALVPPGKPIKNVIGTHQFVYIWPMDAFVLQ